MLRSSGRIRWPIEDTDFSKDEFSSYLSKSLEENDEEHQTKVEAKFSK